MTTNGITKKNTTTPAALSDTFIALFEADRKRIYAYIYAFVMDPDEADEIFQETSVVLWRDFEKFEENTNFSKWANGIVFNRILSYRRKIKKHAVCLSDDVSLELAAKVSQTDSTDSRLEALQICKGELTPTLQQLYNEFYINNATANEVAKMTERSVFAIRKSVQKLRKKLFDCIDRKQQEMQF